MRTRGAHDTDHVLLHGIGHVHFAHSRLRTEQLLDADHLGQRLERMLHALRVEDVHLLVRLRIAELEPDEEAVELRLGQREGALVLDRVLGRHDQERIGELVGRAVDGDLTLLHRLEERGLRLRGRAVDLVGQHDLAHDRTGSELEARSLLVEDRDARHVRGQQIGRELDAPERAAQGAGQGLGEHRLACPGHVLDQEVAATEERDDRELDLVVLAEDDLFDVLDDAGDALAESGTVHDRIVLPSPVFSFMVRACSFQNGPTGPDGPTHVPPNGLAGSDGGRDRRHRPSAARITAPPSGAASSPPFAVFSMSTATATWGSSAGAKPMNHPCGGPLGVSAVPVFPATWTPVIFAPKAKAPGASTAPTRYWVSFAAVSGRMTCSPVPPVTVRRIPPL